MADEAPPIARIDGPLDGVNDAFHEAYDDRRSVAEKDGPILVVVADELVMCRGHERTRLRVTPRAFHVVKSIAHAPVALWILRQRRSEPDRIATLRADVARSIATIDEDLAELDREEVADLKAILARTLDACDRGSETFAQELGPRIQRAIAIGTRIQLAALHARTDEALAMLDADERDALHVAVTGDHQARVRSLPMQYFAKRLGGGERVLYAEGVVDEEEAAALVGTQRLDRALATAFFGDPGRLQRDVLGDAAKTELEGLDL